MGSRNFDDYMPSNLIDKTIFCNIYLFFFVVVVFRFVVFSSFFANIFVDFYSNKKLEIIVAFVCFMESEYKSFCSGERTYTDPYVLNVLNLVYTIIKLQIIEFCVFDVAAIRIASS